MTRPRLLIIRFALWRVRRLHKRASAWSSAIDIVCGRTSPKESDALKDWSDPASDYEITEHGGFSEPLVFSQAR